MGTSQRWNVWKFTNFLKREKYWREESSLQAFSGRKHKSAWKSNVTQQHSNIYLWWSWSSTSWSYQAILGSVYIQQDIRHYVKFKSAWRQNTWSHKICYVILKWRLWLQTVHISLLHTFPHSLPENWSGINLSQNQPHIASFSLAQFHR